MQERAVISHYVVGTQPSIKIQKMLPLPRRENMAFATERGFASRKVWERVTVDVDVLITHEPPKNNLAQDTILGEHLGCADLLQRILRIAPQLHVFGHAHGSRGQEINRLGSRFVNCSVFHAERKLAHPADSGRDCSNLSMT